MVASGFGSDDNEVRLLASSVVRFIRDSNLKGRWWLLDGCKASDLL